MKTLIILACIFTCCLPARAQKTNALQDAMADYDYEKALLLIDQEKPTLPLLYQKGKALKGLGSTAEALGVFQLIVRQDSLNPRAYIEAAECTRSLGKNEQALAYYQKALSLNPDNKFVRIQYIQMLLNTQQYQEAMGESSLMSEKDSSAIVLHLQAQSFEGMDELLPATGCYAIIQDKYPDDYLAAAKLGSLFIGGKYYGEAIKATERYRQIDSTNLAVNRQNALAHCLNKDYPTAIKRYEYLINRGDSSFHTCYYAGISYYAQGDYYKAHDLLEVARKYAPKDVNLLYYLGRACAKTSWKKEGIAYLQEAIHLSIPQDTAMIQLYIGMTECYNLATQYKNQAETIKERYQKYDPQNHKLLYDLAYVHFYNLKDSKSAENYLDAFLKTRPRESKDKQPEIDDQGNVILDKTNYYNAAEAWLKDLRTRKKTENFFQGNVKEEGGKVAK